MSPRSRFSRRWQAARRAPGRVPLRIKLITAVLALVAIALAAISIAGISVLRNYLFGQADAELVGIQDQATRLVQGCLVSPGACPQNGAASVDWLPTNGPLQHMLVPVQTRLGGAPVQPQALPGPQFPPGHGWLSGQSGQTLTVPARSGGDRWRVIAFPTTYHDVVSGQTVSGTILVGIDVSNVYGTINELVSIDVVVSGIVLVALAVAGVAIVRTSLRPLTDIEVTAGAIAAGDLAQRVPDRDPRTEVGRLGRSLNAMLAQIEAAFHARASSEAAARRSEERMRQFVADASHELRTPLTAIRGYAEYYRQRGGAANGTAPAPGRELTASELTAIEPAGSEPASSELASSEPGLPGATAELPAADGGQLSKPDMDRIMQRVEQESARMGVLVEDMLLLARLDRQRALESRPVDLLTLTADAVQDARMIAPEREIELTVAAGAAFIVLGDEPRLRQVIGNLMANALTHTPAGTPITVRISTAGPDEGTPVASAILEVADQGPGLTREQAERAFERFYRADQARARTTGGAGLGLAIVAALVSAHGGTVGVDSEPGQGATFRITLPLADQAA
ncbi:MAG TPA: HAMP domain-containing sensor histidine kinase [Streptosporangiaceae bacterium]